MLDINAKYRKFLSDNANNEEREVRNFKLKAIEGKYIDYLSDVMRVLYQHTPAPPVFG